jgi:hypothetical protein
MGGIGATDDPYAYPTQFDSYDLYGPGEPGAAGGHPLYGEVLRRGGEAAPFGSACLVRSVPYFDG